MSRRKISPEKRPASTILIVDDHPDQRDMYATYFAAHGFRALTAPDGGSAISLAIAEHPSVIVMDLSLPHIDGWEATRHLKRHSATSHIPIIACSAHVLGAASELALDAGCNVFVAKPCLPADLLAEVRTILGPARARRRAS